MKIGILGWGSLLWEGGRDFDHWHEPWQFDGPSLRIEFARISDRRLGALTLVIDPDHGAPTLVAWCLSRRTSLDEAVRDLRVREGTTPQNIGRSIVVGADPAAFPARGDTLDTWTRGQGLDAAIWTALASNFQERRGQAFSVDAALAYIKELPPEAKAQAAEYVWRAPDFVNTPLRTALGAAPWLLQPPGGDGIT